MKHQVIRTVDPEKAILIGVEPKNVPLNTNQVYLDELEFLAYTAGAKSMKRFTQRLDFPNPKTYFGKGKIEENLSSITDMEKVVLRL